MADQKKCAHPACSCMAPEGEKYCSTACHDAGGMLELACNCGHAGCGEKVATSTSGAPTY
jgi:hypothetical protein